MTYKCNQLAVYLPFTNSCRPRWYVNNSCFFVTKHLLFYFCLSLVYKVLSSGCLQCLHKSLSASQSCSKGGHSNQTSFCTIHGGTVKIAFFITLMDLSLISASSLFCLFFKSMEDESHKCVCFQQCSRDHKEKLTLQDLMIMPVQRIPRYELILKVSICGVQLCYVYIVNRIQ